MGVQEAEIYTTQNVDLASFLVLHGVSLIRCYCDPSKSHVVLMDFSDPKDKCSDLELVYLKSEHKVFRDINKQMLKRVHTTLKG